MQVTTKKEEQVAKLIFGIIYPHYLKRIEQKDRTKEELEQVIAWFTGYDRDTLQGLIDDKVNYRDFFAGATIHPNVKMIKSEVCGYRIEKVEDEFELYRQCRQMEKLIDELARGRKMEKILREEKK